MQISHKSPYDGQEFNLSVSISTYRNKQKRIKLFDIEDGLPYAEASVCIEDYSLNEGEVAIKNYSENQGILESLIDYGVVEPPHAFVKTTWVKVPICRLKIS